MTEEQYKEVSCEVIRNYLNINLPDEIILKKYKVAVFRLISKAKILIERESESVGVKSIKEGDSSITYDDNAIPFLIDSEIKVLLPTPYVRMY